MNSLPICEIIDNIFENLILHRQTIRIDIYMFPFDCAWKIEIEFEYISTTDKIDEYIFKCTAKKSKGYMDAFEEI